MNLVQPIIPEATIEAVARSLYRETNHYGFKQVDYLRFVNLLLDMSLKTDENKLNLLSEIKYDNEILKIPLIGDRVDIRHFDKKNDIELLDKWVDDNKGRYFLLSRLSAKKLTIENLIENKQNFFGVITLKDKVPIGLLAYFNIDHFQHKAELRKLIGEPAYRGKGFAKEATKLWLQYGISTLKLKKIYLNTLDTNIRNIKLNEELGFKVEGILRNECYIDGKYHDILKMGFWRG